jgi:hypothetical protein
MGAYIDEALALLILYTCGDTHLAPKSFQAQVGCQVLTLADIDMPRHWHASFFGLYGVLGLLGSRLS